MHTARLETVHVSVSVATTRCHFWGWVSPAEVTADGGYHHQMSLAGDGYHYQMSLAEERGWGIPGRSWVAYLCHDACDISKPPPPHTHIMTDTYENITFPQLR